MKFYQTLWLLSQKTLPNTYPKQLWQIIENGFFDPQNRQNEPHCQP